jgi:hypothetical protein
MTNSERVILKDAIDSLNAVMDELDGGEETQITIYLNDEVQCKLHSLFYGETSKPPERDEDGNHIADITIQ